MNKKIYILGTEYDFMVSIAENDSDLISADGAHNGLQRFIKINAEPLQGEKETRPEYIKLCKRHEIVHAFMFQCGLEEWNQNELLVDWIAHKFPQMLAAMQEVDAL